MCTCTQEKLLATQRVEPQTVTPGKDDSQVMDHHPALGTICRTKANLWLINEMLFGF